MKRRHFIKFTMLSIASAGVIDEVNGSVVKPKDNNEMAGKNDKDFININKAVNNPYIITGRANIKNPRWKAPTLAASEPDAASENAKAINMMLQSGNKNVEFDDVSRYINSTAIIHDSITLIGPGRSVPSLIWNGNDSPIIARAGYTDKNLPGVPNVRIIDLRLTDLAESRKDFYSIELTNGDSCGLERCWLDGRKGQSLDDKYGVALGRAIGSNNKLIKAFVTHIKDTRLSSSTLLINSTDYYISGSEIWGNNRNHAIKLGGGGSISGGTQIVPGATSGIYLFNDSNNDIDTLRVIGVYFDGSTNKDIFTGWGILSDKEIGLKSAEIIGCDFWHLNKGGIKLKNLHSSTITSNFRDCDSDDTGEDDIVISDVYGSYINNRHFRSLAPKSGSERVNLGRPYSLFSHLNASVTMIGGQVNSTETYIDGIVEEESSFDSIGGSPRTSFTYDNFPNARNFIGKVLNVNGRPNFSTGQRFSDISNDAIELSLSEELNALCESGRYYIDDISGLKNIPNFNGPCLLDVTYIKTSHAIQQLIEINTGKMALRMLSHNHWDGWKFLVE